MASRNGNTAYDFAMFEPKRRAQEAPAQKPNVIELPQERLEENRRPKHRLGRALPAAMAFVVIAGLVGSFIYGQVQMTELTESLSAATKTLSESQSDYTQLQMKSDSKLSLETVENYATQKLGMKKATQDQVTTVQLSKGDKAEIVQKDGNSGLLGKLWGFLRQSLS